MANSLATKANLIYSKAFNLPALKKSRWKWVDYLKGIAIVLVVYRHVLIGIQRSGIIVPEWLVTANMIFFSFRMPLFFILSGIFISGSFAKRSVSQLLSTKFENILYPYLVWSFIQVSLQIALGGGMTNSNRSIKDYLYILYQPRGLDQFWYLPALFFTIVVFVLIKKYFNPPHWVQLILGLIFYFTSPYLQSVSIVSDWMAFYVFFALGDAISKLFFQPKTQALLKNAWSLLLMTPIFVAAQLYYLHNNVGELAFLVISLIGCAYMFLLAFRMEQWNILNFLRVLGFHSLYIYVMHVIIAGFVRLALVRVFHIHIPELLLLVGIFSGVTIPVIVFNLFIKDNVGWFLIFHA